MPSKISLAMIVKNEADHLAECLESIKGLADEICIVDTGSNDSTINIARKYGAKVTIFLWCDDFSAARNESLRLCTMDWIFVLDADERLAEGDLDTIRDLARGPSDRSFRFVTRNYTNTTSVSKFTPCAADDPMAHGFAGWFPSTKVRLFPNNRGAQFEGKVHELVNPSLERLGIRIQDADVPIHHYAQVKPPEHIREKQNMYLKLGHEKIKEDPSNPKHYTELGAQYMEVGSYEDAAAAFKEAVRLDPRNPWILKDLGTALYTMKKYDEAQQALRIALQLDPDLTDAWRNLGVVLIEKQAWEEALECFDNTIALDPAWQEGHRYRSVALQGAGRLQDAATAARKALETCPRSAECLSLYIHQMLRLEMRGEARSALTELLTRYPDNPDLENALGELCYYDEMYDDAKRHFSIAAKAGHAGGYNNLGVIHFKLRNFDQAKAAYEQCLAIDPGHKGARAGLEKVIHHLSKA